MSIGAVLTIIFVVLKLLGEIDWSWWWVISPTLIEIGTYIVIVGGYALIRFWLLPRWHRRRS